MGQSDLTWGEGLGLAMQRAVGWVLAPAWLPTTVALMRFGFGWHIEGTAEARRVYQALWRSGDPLLVCANHLTLIDSALVAWALGSPAWFLVHYGALPWNVPERRNFASSSATRVAAYVAKCLPITRGGDRAEIGHVLRRLLHLLERGEVILMFPEGGRSRSGVVEVERAAYGVGRVIAASPACQVLCVYVRGEGQDGFSDLPAFGERFHVRVETFRPSSVLTGMRRSRDLAQQVTRRLAELERAHFENRCGVDPDRAPSMAKTGR
jgi:hypothetical protein